MRDITTLELENNEFHINKNYKIVYSIKRSYYMQLKKDLMIYGNCFEEKVKYKWWQKIIRLIQRMPIDRRYVNPNDVII